jgi:hypothetical protein
MNVAKRYPIFLQMATFTNAWERYALADDALRELEEEIKGRPNEYAEDDDAKRGCAEG